MIRTVSCFLPFLFVAGFASATDLNSACPSIPGSEYTDCDFQGPAETYRCPDWSILAPLAQNTLLLDGAVVDSSFIVVGARGHVLRSHQEQEWSQSKVPTCNLLSAIHMHDANLGWAVGHDAIVMRTKDGGSSWKIVYSAPDDEVPLLDVWFRNAMEGVAIGAYGYYLETSDGGESWSARYISEEEDFHLNAITSAGESRLYIAAEAGNLYRSDDGGENWHKLDSPYEGSWLAIHAFNEDKLLIAGLRGNLYRSDDGGKNWVQIPTNTRAILTGITQISSGEVVVTGTEGTVLISSDGGQTFANNNLSSRAAISTALPYDQESILLLGEFGIRKHPRVN